MNRHIRSLAAAAAPAACIGALLFSACAAPPARVADVWSVTRTETIPEADRDLFGMDRASHLRVESTPLPLSQQRQEFYVAWSGAGVRLVRFEYRQANAPDTVSVQTAPAAGRRSTVFTVAGDDYHNGGPVSAWRVTLWDADRLLAEKKSMLW
jgi:hypothetical protein